MEGDASHAGLCQHHESARAERHRSGRLDGDHVRRGSGGRRRHRRARRHVLRWFSGRRRSTSSRYGRVRTQACLEDSGTTRARSTARSSTSRAAARAAEPVGAELHVPAERRVAVARVPRLRARRHARRQRHVPLQLGLNGGMPSSSSATRRGRRDAVPLVEGADVLRRQGRRRAVVLHRVGDVLADVLGTAVARRWRRGARTMTRGARGGGIGPPPHDPRGLRSRRLSGARSAVPCSALSALAGRLNGGGVPNRLGGNLRRILDRPDQPEVSRA